MYLITPYPGYSVHVNSIYLKDESGKHTVNLTELEQSLSCLAGPNGH